ncbi:MAG: hypothetical protein WDA27_03095 [Actinomycetota bacterium]
MPATPIYLALIAVNSAVWMHVYAWPDDTSNVMPLAVSTAVTALLAGLVTREPARRIGIASVAGPAVLALFTASRGDEDGLWGLVYVYLVGLAILSTFLGERFGRGPEREGAPAWVQPAPNTLVSDVPALQGPTRVSSASAWILAVTAIAAGVVAIVSNWPRPYADIRAALSAIDLSGFERVSERRSGDALSTARPPQLALLVQSAQRQGRACEALRTALHAADVVIRSIEEPCDITGRFAGRFHGGRIGFYVTPASRAPEPRPARFYVVGVFHAE